MMCYIIVGVLVVIVLILVGYIVFKKDSFDGPDSLTAGGWKVYLSTQCGYCTRQKQVLDSYYPNFKNFYIDQAPDVPIEGVPTWISRNGMQFPGFKTYEQLEQMAKDFELMAPKEGYIEKTNDKGLLLEDRS